MNRDRLRDDLALDEGIRLHPYKDTVGKLTIGIGRNLTDVGISLTEAYHLLDNDLVDVESDLNRACPWWLAMPEPAQRALANMCFNLGWPRLSRFHAMLTALQFGDYEKAATEALDSAWAAQVGNRAHRIADLYRQAGMLAT